MAEPLTSSDIIRENLGFGPSTTDEKRRAAAAGISPLGTMERERFERGAGLSPMASTTEREAWVAAEVQAGKRDPMELPKDYGGLGERPEATTRRGFRMQQEWDKQYEMMMEQQKVARETEDNAKRLEILQRDQQLQESDFYYNRGLKEAEQKLQAQQRSEAMSLVAGLNNLDPRDPEYREKRGKLYSAYPLGATDQGVQKVAGEYEAVNSVYQESLNKEAAENEKFFLNTEPKAALYGIDSAPFRKANDKLGLLSKIGEAEKEETRELEKDKRIEKLDSEKRGVVAGYVKQLADLDGEIAKNIELSKLATTESVKREYIDQATGLGAQRDILKTNYIDPLLGPNEEEKPQSFDSVEAAQSANLPKGTIVVIGGRRARID